MQTTNHTASGVVMRNSAGRGHGQNRHSYHFGGGGASAEATSSTSLVRCHPFGGSAERISESPSYSQMLVAVPRDELCSSRNRLSGNFSSRLAAVREEMSSASDRNSPRGVIHIDTLQQGPDVQTADSPRGSTISGSSKGESQQSQSHTHPQLMTQGGYPIHGQVLVDPATGQHYIVPQTSFFQPMQPMQPMYYPPPQPAPMFFPYPHQSMSGHPQGYHPPGVVPMPQYGNVPMMGRQFSSTAGPYHPVQTQVEERKTIESFEDPTPPSPSLRSTPPRTVFPSSPAMLQTTSFSQQYRQQQQNPIPIPVEQPDDPESGFRRPSASRGSTERPNTMLSQLDRQASGEREWRPKTTQERTPLYGGPPPWWSTETASSEVTPTTHNAHSDVEGRPRMSPPNRQASTSDVEATRPTSSYTVSLPTAPRPPASKPVRMDIDLSTPVQEERIRPVQTVATKSVRMEIELDSIPTLPERTKVVPRAPATAFTVNFDNPEGDVSLQDAARKSAQARRILTRRTGNMVPEQQQPTPRQEVVDHPPVPTPSGGANKKYLLQKLLSGQSEREETSEMEASIEIGDDADGSVVERRDNDAVSETGTFVIDTSRRPGGGVLAHHMMMPSRIIEDSDATDDSCSDSESEVNTPRAPPPPRHSMLPTPQQQPKPVILPPISLQPVVRQQFTSRPATTNTSTPPVRSDKSGGFLQELAKLRQMAGLPAAGPPGTNRTQVSPRSQQTADTSRLPPSVASTAASRGRQSRMSAASNASRSVQRPTTTQTPDTNRSRPTQPISTNNNSRFSRGDGGRLSLRSTAPTPPTPSSPQTGQRRPPFRTGVAAGRISLGQSEHQREQEMTAWLRRKDYNPMRAAAEAKKAKDIKSREEQFASSRSISFHVGPQRPPPSMQQHMSYGRLTRQRSQESLAEDAATQASQRLIAEYSRGVVSDINRLSQQTSRPGGASKMSGLSRAVDMLSQKCKKSIELIRSQNKGCLSVSVEDLLSAAAEAPRPDESLNEQLERLSDAFDAVQRYLEQYSLDGHNSPIPDHFYDEDMQSAVTGFSNASLRSRSNSNEGASQQMSSYRSKILAAQKN